jgi:hypothetical protein
LGFSLHIDARNRRRPGARICARARRRTPWSGDDARRRYPQRPVSIQMRKRRSGRSQATPSPR